MEVEILSTECIKPSSRTHSHLETYNFSFIDQFNPPIYIPLVLYYDSAIDQVGHMNVCITDFVLKRLQILKQSLSEVLTIFYPFAGVIKNKLYIDCNDEGVYFIKARTKSNIFLSEFLKQPDLSLINKFLPTQTTLSQQPVPGSHVALIQVTTFACGGIVIGISACHLLVDGKSLSTFLKSWAATARKSCLKEETTPYNINPNFDSSYVFPSNDVLPEEVTYMTMIVPLLKTARWVSKRIVFDASTIAKLKSKATSSRVENPTRVETVSAMLLKCIQAAFRVSNSFDIHKSTLLTHAVNLRPRAIPPFSQQSIGNYVCLTVAPLSKNEEDQEEEEFEVLVCHMREAIRKIDGDFIKRLQGDKGFVNFIEANKSLCKVLSSVDEYVAFTSWCRFGFYEVDFGWGKPSWVSCFALESSPTPSVNSIILMDTRSGDGIEAWVYLPEEDMAILQRNDELRSYALLDFSPLG